MRFFEDSGVIHLIYFRPVFVNPTNSPFSAYARKRKRLPSLRESLIAA
ncbi:hypothetical protein OH687_31235 [Burkholderia anthina]|nr:hypothetical protein OH687_31235 [Burkholderia anthina]